MSEINSWSDFEPSNQEILDAQRFDFDAYAEEYAPPDIFADNLAVTMNELYADELREEAADFYTEPAIGLPRDPRACFDNVDI